MPKIADRVVETTTTTGTGAFSLGGAKAGFRPFLGAFSNGDTVYYACVGATEWELGSGTLAGGALSRDSVLASSNGGAEVPFSAGTKDIFCTAPARMLSGGTVNVPFRTAIPFTGQEQMPMQYVAGPLSFTVDTSGAVDGAMTTVDLIANGANAPAFSAPLRQWGGSMAYDNRNGIRNSLTFFRRGGAYYYAVSVAVGAVAEAAPAAPAFTVAPAIAGTASVGFSVTFISGTVIGTPTPTVTRQWTINGIDVLGETGLTYTPQAGDTGQQLRVRQTATNASGTSTSTSQPVTVAAALTAPGAVTSLTAGTPSTTSIPLTWALPATGGGSITDYVLQYAAAGTSFATPITVSDGTSAVLSGTVTGLVESTSYDVRVAAVNAAGTGPFAQLLGVTTAATLTAPGPVTSLANGTPTETSIPLTWVAPSTGGGSVTDYIIQYAAAGTSFASPVTVSDGTSTTPSATVTGLTAGTAYDLRVAAVNSAGTGSYVSLTNISTAAAAPVATAIALANIVTLTESPSGTYTASAANGSGSGGALGLDGDGYIMVDHSSFSNQFKFGFDTVANKTPYNTVDFILWLYTNDRVFRLENAGTGTELATVAYGPNVKLRIKRTGTTLTVESSTNSGTNWSVIGTFAATSSARLYPVFFADINGTSKIINPKGLGLT